jgi:hypothetical protein
MNAFSICCLPFDALAIARKFSLSSTGEIDPEGFQ